MARKDWGGDRRRAVKTTTNTRGLSAAAILAVFGTAACADTNDRTLSEDPDATETSNDLSPSLTAANDTETHETVATSNPGAAGGSTASTSASNTTAHDDELNDDELNEDVTDQDTSSGQTSTDASDDEEQEAQDTQPEFPDAQGADYAFARGGTRLAAVHFKAADAERFLHFYDRELGHECAFEKIAGREDYACAPVEPIEISFLDQACTQPIVLSWRDQIAHGRPSGTPNVPLVPVPQDFVGSWVTTRGAVDCNVKRNLGTPSEVAALGSDLPARGEISGLYQVGESVELTANEGASVATVFALVDGVCQSTNAMVRIRQPADSAYLLEPQAVDELVTARVQTFKAGTDFAVQRLIATDGSWQTLHPVDRWGEACELLADGRCLPGPIAQLAHANMFPSDTCDTPVVDVLGANGAPCNERYGVEATAETAIFELVSLQDAGYYQKWQPIDPNTGEMLPMQCDGIGSELVARGEAQREFSIAESVMVGKPELRARTSAAAGTTVALHRDVDFVLEDDTVCDVNLFDDGVYRCHAHNPGVIDGLNYAAENRVLVAQADIYGDAECEQHVYMEQQGANPDLPFWNLTTSFHAMVPFDGRYYRDYGGVCTALEESLFSSRVFLEAEELSKVLPVVERMDL